MEHVEYYRAQAQFCAQMAETVRDEENRGHWRWLVAQWHQLADYIEQRGQSKRPN